MTHHTNRDPERLAATQLAELAQCEARMVLRWRQAAAGKPEPQVDSGKAKARAAGVAEHASFHRQVTRFHNQSVRSSQPEGSNKREGDSRGVVAPGRPAGSKYCFIATVIFGTEHPRTWQLRRYRERYLRPHAVGRWVAVRYYRHAPAVAGWLSRHPRTQAPTRMVLGGLCLLLTPWTKE